MTEKLPQKPGVYIFKDSSGEIIYVGKAANLKRRVGSYFSGKRERKTESIAENVESVHFEETDTVIEAFIREAELIKKHKPRYNVKDKDDRSFLYVVITKEKYPRVLLKRGRDVGEARSVFGPFVFSSEIRSALRLVRKIFPFSTHTEREMGKPCFYYQINLCPGTCVGAVSKKDYLKEIRNIEMFFKGKKKSIIRKLKKEMKEASDNEQFERAEEIRRKIHALEHIQDTALISRKKEEGQRLEGYDISNISGEHAVGSMVVFSGEVPLKKDYRIFKINSVEGQNDTGMIKEILERRLNNDWPLPSLILVDGGRGQISAAKEALDKAGVDIPVVGSVKGERKRIIGKIPSGIKRETLIHLQNEAHRFALKHHRRLREKYFYGN